MSKPNSEIDSTNLDIEMPFFEAKCINNSSRCKLIYVGCAKKDKVVGDYPIEFNTPKEMIETIGKNAYTVCEYKQYNVIAKIMCCTINGGYLTRFDTIPCYYMTLLYNSKFGVAGTVVTIGLNFVIDNNQLTKISLPYQEEQQRIKLERKSKSKKSKITKKNIIEPSKNSQGISSEPEKTFSGLPECSSLALEHLPEPTPDEVLPLDTNNSTDELKNRTIEIDLKKLINRELTGSYYINITCDKDERDNFLNKMKLKYNISSNLNEQSPENLKKYEEYATMFIPIKLECYSNKNVIIYNKFIKYLKNEKFMDFVHFILDERFNDKIKEVGHLFDHKIPKNIFSYKKLKDNPELVDQMLNDDDRDSNKSSDNEELM